MERQTGQQMEKQAERQIERRTEKKVWEYIREKEMISEGDFVVAGVSGGADSMCLAELLRRYRETAGFSLKIVHINHGIRGEDADADEAYVRRYCSDHGLDFFAVSCDVPLLARQEGISLEEAGRTARYKAFGEMCLEWKSRNADGMGRSGNGNAKIALAHHQDDLAETMLHHLARGTGISGLCSLKPVSENRIRPLLCLTREEIEAYLAARHISWRTDSTNGEDDYTRNRIRHNIMPNLKEMVNPAAVSHMAQTARELEEIDAFLQKMAEECMRQYVIREDSNSFFREGMRQTESVLQKKLFLIEMKRISGRQKDFERVHVEAVRNLWEKQVGKRIRLPYGLEGIREYTGIRLTVKEAGRDEREQCSKRTGYLLPIPGILTVEDFTVECALLDLSRNSSEAQKNGMFPSNFSQIPEKKYTKWFDYGRIKGNAEFRHRQSGDRISVHPSGGSKKLKDYLIDRKIPREERDALWLLTSGNDVVWIVGDRMNQNYKVTETTRQVLYMRIEGGKFRE